MSKEEKLAPLWRQSNPLHTDIRQILQNAHSKAQSAVNTAMVEAYWLIGKRIVEEEQQGESKENAYQH